ncbi:MAG: hypothetical protein JO022_13090, partial [Acidobacteriaceae bacterium]|nr:hypothetical protein [Acidobacteriaceae bacterium]
MGTRISRHTELKRRGEVSRRDSVHRFESIEAADTWLQQFRPDGALMHKLRDVLCEFVHDAARLTDEEVLDMCAWNLANGNILLSHSGATPPPARTVEVGKK